MSFERLRVFSLISARSWRTEDQPLAFGRVQLVLRCIFPLDAVPRYFPYGGFYSNEVHACWLNQIRKKNPPSRIPFFIPGPLSPSSPSWWAGFLSPAGRK